MKIYFKLNGENVSVENMSAENDSSLLDVLREQFDLKAAKAGCREGSCGSCTVLVDQKPVRACVLSVEKVADKSVTTLEGILDDPVFLALERQFLENGALQCGFCTPGFVIASYSLIKNRLTADNHANKMSKAEIALALKGNLCRCTGYLSIFRAVQQTFEALNNKSATCKSSVGSPFIRPDAPDKLRGLADYAVNLSAAEMLHGATLRSPYKKARIKRLDVSAAKSMSGVVAVLTAQDIPGIKTFGAISRDQPVLAEETTQFQGEAIAIAAATTPEIARAAIDSIIVEWEELDAVTDPLTASLVMCAETFGDKNAEGIAMASDFSVQDTYTTTWVEHGYMETECCLAIPGKYPLELFIYSSSQNTFHDRELISAVLNIPAERIRVILTTTGGSFGGKEDIHTQIHTALLCQKTGKPVKMEWSREESLLASTKKHPFTIKHLLGCNLQGQITAAHIDIIADCGPYASLSSPVLTRAATHAMGPYKVPHLHVTARGIRTNNPISGAMRGFGTNQTCFATESQIDRLAASAGFSPAEFRLKNIARSGESFSMGQSASDDSHVQALHKAINIENRWKKECGPEYSTGMAICLKNVGLGNNSPFESSTADIGFEKRTGWTVYYGGAEIGQGLVAVCAITAGNALGIPPKDITVICGDTGHNCPGGVTSASRQTYMGSNAVYGAIGSLMEKIGDMAYRLFGAKAEEVQYTRNGPSIPTHNISAARFIHAILESGEKLEASYTYTAPTTAAIDKRDSDDFRLHVDYTFVAQIALISINEKGLPQVHRIASVQNPGIIVDPACYQGQVEGGIAMGIGYALSERYIPGSTSRLGSCGLIRFTDMPDVEIEDILHEDPDTNSHLRGIGEATCVPTAPAISNALANLTGVWPHSLPLLPAKGKR